MVVQRFVSGTRWRVTHDYLFISVWKLRPDVQDERRKLTLLPTELIQLATRKQLPLSLRKHAFVPTDKRVSPRLVVANALFTRGGLVGEVPGPLASVVGVLAPWKKSRWRFVSLEYRICSQINKYLPQCDLLLVCECRYLMKTVSESSIQEQVSVRSYP